MTDIQRLWISKVIHREQSKLDTKSRLDATRNRVFGRRRR